MPHQWDADIVSLVLAVAGDRGVLSEVFARIEHEHDGRAAHACPDALPSEVLELLAAISA
jgi:hypothetical protein